MIRVGSVEVVGQSERGGFRGAFTFAPGLQVFTGPNDYGKSLAASAVAWCLGLEVMYGLARGNSALFPAAVRDRLELNGSDARVLSSQARLELVRDDSATLVLTRSIVGGDVGVVEYVQQSGKNRAGGKLVLGSGSMTDEVAGFQSHLIEWMGWPSRQIMTTKGVPAQIYLENIAPLFIVEQLEGWNDVQSLQVYRYGSVEIAEAAFEYLLGLDDRLLDRFSRQRQDFEQASLKKEVASLLDRVRDLLTPEGWVVDLSTVGSVQSIARRVERFKITAQLLEKFDVNFEAEKRRLEELIAALGKHLTSATVDVNRINAAEISQRVIDVKERRHDLAQQTRDLRNQLAEQQETLSSLEHRIGAATDLLRLKTRDVGILPHTECPTCHRDIAPEEFELSEQSRETIEAHIESLNRERQLVAREAEAIREQFVGLAAALRKAEADYLAEEQSLRGFSRALGPTNEAVIKATADLLRAERELERIMRLSRGISDLQGAFADWLDKVHKLGEQHVSDSKSGAKLESFIADVRRLLLSLGYGDVTPGNVQSLRLDERYVLHLGERRLRALGSASDRARLVMTYVLGCLDVAEAFPTHHAGFVLLDEPLQQNPDPEHRALFLKFLKSQKARKRQVIVFTSLDSFEEADLAAAGLAVSRVTGTHFLSSASTKTPR